MQQLLLAKELSGDAGGCNLLLFNVLPLPQDHRADNDSAAVQ